MISEGLCVVTADVLTSASEWWMSRTSSTRCLVESAIRSTSRTSVMPCGYRHSRGALGELLRLWLPQNPGGRSLGPERTPHAARPNGLSPYRPSATHLTQIHLRWGRPMLRPIPTRCATLSCVLPGLWSQPVPKTVTRTRRCAKAHPLRVRAGRILAMLCVLREVSCHARVPCRVAGRGWGASGDHPRGRSVPLPSRYHKRGEAHR